MSGGGSLGAVQVGMITALYDRGVVPDMLVGTSVGALNAGYLANRPATPRTAKDLADVWQELRRSDVFPAQPFRGLLALFGQRDHLVPNDGLRDLLREHLAMKKLEESQIPFTVIATDLVSGREVELTEGSAQDAIMASAAIPGIFPPVRWDDMILVDGGVSNYTPLSPALRAGAETIYVLPTGKCDLREVPDSALGVLLQSLAVMIMQRMNLEVAQYQGQTKLIVLPPPCPLETQPADFTRAGDLIRRSRDDAHAYLDRIEAGERLVPGRLERAQE